MVHESKPSQQRSYSSLALWRDETPDYTEE